MYKEQMIFYNPLLNPDDIVIAGLNDGISASDFDTPQPEEILASVIGLASQENSTLGGLIKDVDNLFEDGDLP